MGYLVAMAGLVALGAGQVVADSGSPDPAPQPPVVAAAPPTQLTTAQMFDLAAQAERDGDLALAETTYRALVANREEAIGLEARFRLALLYADRMGRVREGAVLLREILDRQPDTGRTRLELARLLALMGDRDGAAREVRAAQAGGLPPEVARLVRFYAQALDAARPLGGSVQVALAPDTNINRATRSDTLETVLGDFTLDEDARETSGIGLSLQGQAFARLPLARGHALLARLSGAGLVYRRSRFDDYTLSLQVGPQLRLGRDRLDIAATGALRWYGQVPYSRSYGVTANYRHPLSDKAQLRIDGGVLRSDNRRNSNQDGTNFSAGIGIDRALSAKAGVGVRLTGARYAARDPAWSTASGDATAFVFREIGATTLVGDLGYGRLEADARAFLYPERRRDSTLHASLSGTFRQIKLLGLAPLLRLEYEHNSSTIDIYDYSRLAARAGVTAAF